MSKRRRAFFIRVLPSALLLFSGACLIVFALLQNGDAQWVRTTDTPTVTFAMYGDMQTQAIVEEAAARFEKQQKCNVHVYCYATARELREKTIGQFAAGKAFDVFYADWETVKLLCDKDYILPLDDVLANRVSTGDEYYASALAAGRVGDVLYAMPTGIMPYLIYYNRSIFTQAGVPSPQDCLDQGNWDQDALLANLDALYRQTGKTVLAFDGDAIALSALTRIGGGRWRGGADGMDDAMRDTLSKLRQRVQSGAVDVCDADALARFTDGEIPLIIEDLSMTREMRIGKGFEWDVAPFPSPRSDFSGCVFSVPMIIAAKGSNEALSKAFVDFYVSGFCQKLRLEYGECLLPSLNMTFYTSMGDVSFPNHSNYYFFALENGCVENRGSRTSALYAAAMAELTGETEVSP